jgi:hypothetical protein
VSNRNLQSQNDDLVNLLHDGVPFTSTVGVLGYILLSLDYPEKKIFSSD